MIADSASGPEDFEGRLRLLLTRYGPGPEGGPAQPILHRLLDRATPLATWDNVVAALLEHGVPGHEAATLRPLYLIAGRRRRPRDLILEGTDFSGPVPPPVAVPVLEDADGVDLKPDPLNRLPAPADFRELDALLLKYWAWAGRPSSRRLAAASGGAFSHATVNRLTGSAARGTGRPFSVRQGYVRAFIQACGGPEDDQRRWVSAWRRVDEACS